MITRDVSQRFAKLFPVGITVGEDQIAWARIAHLSDKPIEHIAGALSVVTVNANSSSNDRTKIHTARFNLHENAKALMISKPKMYRHGGIIYLLSEIVPRQGKIWRVIRVVVHELKHSSK
jgi:hypothetical protein